jgi:hypothetical protein
MKHDEFDSSVGPKTSVPLNYEPKKRRRLRFGSVRMLVYFFVGAIVVELIGMPGVPDLAQVTASVFRDLTPFKVANLIEAVFWVTMGVICGSFALCRTGVARHRLAVTFLVFLAFDLVFPTWSNRRLGRGGGHGGCSFGR